MMKNFWRQCRGGRLTAILADVWEMDKWGV